MNEITAAWNDGEMKEELSTLVIYQIYRLRPEIMTGPIFRTGYNSIILQTVSFAINFCTLLTDSAYIPLDVFFQFGRFYIM